jgi:conjugal transfer mating pair stabilization protein TraG
MFNYEIITYGGGNVLNGVFEAIARMRGVGFGSSVFSGIIIIAVLCAYIRTVVENAFNTDIRQSIRWALGWMVFLTLCYVQTVNVIIVDKTLNHSKPVANVPFGLALFASLSSQLSDVLTAEFEKQFSVPDNHQSFRKHGILFSQSLITAANQFEIVNPRIERNFRNFARQCVLYDVRIGNKYSLEDLIYAPNAWELIKTKTSQLRMFDYHTGQTNQIKTCLEGAKDLDKDLKVEAERNQKLLAWRFFGQGKEERQEAFANRKSQLAQQVITNELGPAHAFLTNMSGDAANILKQHMVRNAIKDSVIKNAEIVGATAAAQGFAVARAQEQQRNTFQILGDLSGKALVNLTIVFQAILYGSFMLIILLVVQPNGFQILKSYLGLVFWVQSWPPLFAVINYIQTEELRSASIAAATYVDGSGTTQVGWNLFTSPAIVQANLDIAALAGFYSISVPLIAISLVKGVESFLTLATHLGAVTQGAANQAAEEMTTGNYSYGNVNLDNMSANNHNANHWNTATTYSAMRKDFELSSGSILGEMGDGKSILNQSATMSSLSVSVKYDSLYSAAIQAQSVDAQSALYTKGVSYANSVAAATATTLQIVQSGGFNVSENTTIGTHDAHSLAKRADTVKQFQDSFAIQHGLNQDQVAQISATAYAELSGLNLGPVKAGLRVDIQGLSSAKQTELVQAAKDAMISNHLTDSVDHVVRAGKDMHFTSGNEQQKRLMDEHRANVDTMERTEKTYQASLQKADSLSKMASVTHHQGIGIHQDLQQFTFEKLSHLRDEKDQELGGSGVDHILQDPEMARRYIHQIVQADIKQVERLYEKNALKDSDMLNIHQENSSGIKTMDTIRQEGERYQAEIYRKAENLGIKDIYNKDAIGHEVQSEYEKIQDKAVGELSAGEKKVEGEVATRQTHVLNEQQLKKNLLDTAAQGAVNQASHNNKMVRDTMEMTKKILQKSLKKTEE